jgi:hypothetical protein
MTYQARLSRSGKGVLIGIAHDKVLCEAVWLSQVFAGQNVGIKEIAEKVWFVSFMHYDFGFVDHETRRVECAPTRSVPPFAVSKSHRNTWCRAYALASSNAGSLAVGSRTESHDGWCMARSATNALRMAR